MHQPVIYRAALSEAALYEIARRCHLPFMTRRLFIALPVPAHISEALLDTMEGIPGARWQDADNLHITLRFIGETDRHLEADLLTALCDIRFAPFSVSLAGLGHFDGPKRARSIWAAVQQNINLEQLQASAEIACQRAGCPAETRKFLPHVTLARLNSGCGPIGGWLQTHGALALPAWRAEHFSLFESSLTPGGPIYSEIHRFP